MAKTGMLPEDAKANLTVTSDMYRDASKKAREERGEQSK